jgi:multiple sugar transport system permease protein
MIPWIIGFFLINFVPMIYSFYLSFTNPGRFLQGGPFHEFVGLNNFIRAFSDPRFINSMRVTIIYVLIGVPLQLAAALAIAVLLNRGMRGLPFYRSALYLPSMMGGSVAIAILWRQVFGTQGLVNTLLTMLGRSGPGMLGGSWGWISHPDTALSTIILLHVWTFGSPMIIFLAGLRNIPTMYYEAAAMDGASQWRQFRSITLRLLTPIILFNLVLQIIGAFQSFTQAFIVSGGTGGPVDSTLFAGLYIYNRSFTAGQWGYAASLSWILLVIIGITSALIFASSRFWVHYDD